MDVKTAFLNCNLEEDLYMEQPKGFVEQYNNKLVRKLKKSIDGLEQDFRQWYLKFNNIVTVFGFTKKTVDHCIYLRVSGRKFTIIVLYVKNIILASNDLV